MEKKRFISLVLLFLFVISILSCTVYAKGGKGSKGANGGGTDNESYDIHFANIDLFIGADGNLHVKEQIHYSFFSGSYPWVYRNITIGNGERIENVNIHANGAYSSYEIINKSGMDSIKIYLYNNLQKTVPINDKDVDVFIEYDFINKIKIYNDIAELQYALRSENWEEPPEQLNTTIHLKSSNNVKYWLNPLYPVQKSDWNDNTLKVTTTLYEGNNFELIMAIPKDQFMANPLYAQKINGSGLEKMDEIQKNYENKFNSLTENYILWALIMLLSTIFPLIIYFFYGRDPKIDYSAEYESDLPTGDPPAIVNAIYGGFNIGEPDMDGFKATILDLIVRDYLLIEEAPSKEDKPKVIKLRVNPNSKRSELKEFELNALNFMEKFKRNNVISLDEFKNSLKEKRKAESFKKSYDRWNASLEKEFLNDEIMNNIFVKKGSTYLKIYGILGLIVAVLTFVVSYFDAFPAASYTFYGSIVLAIVSIMSIIMRQSIGGHWTVYGKENYLKWQNFKKYILNIGLMGEYSSKSLKNLNKYIVYGTALGITDEVKKSMEKLPLKEVLGITMSILFYFEILDVLSSSLDSAMNTADGSDGDSEGDFDGDSGDGWGD